MKHRCLFLGWDVCLSVTNEDSQRPTTFNASEIFNDEEVEINIIRGNVEELEKDTEKSSTFFLRLCADIFLKPSEKPIKQLFIEFLKREEVIERYKRNWLFCDHYNYHRPIEKKEFYIHQAFLWRPTPEGLCFWEEINTKWLEHLESVWR